MRETPINTNLVVPYYGSLQLTEQVAWPWPTSMTGIYVSGNVTVPGGIPESAKIEAKSRRDAADLDSLKGALQRWAEDHLIVEADEYGYSYYFEPTGQAYRHTATQVVVWLLDKATVRDTWSPAYVLITLDGEMIVVSSLADFEEIKP